MEETSRPGFWERMEARWGVTRFGVVMILLAFALAGSTVLKISGPIMNFIVPETFPRWLWWICRFAIIVPVYEVLLLTFGTLLGQRTFFWNHQKKMLGRITGKSKRRESA